MKYLNVHSQRTVALIGGLSLIIMAIAAGVAYGYAHAQLVVPSSAEQTFFNIKNNKSLFTLEIIAWWLTALTDIIVSWVVYTFFKASHTRLATAAGLLRLLYSLVFIVGICYLFIAYTDRDAVTVMASILQFEKLWSLALIVISGHLICLGLIVLRCDLIPNWIGVLLLFAGLCYFVIHFTNNFLPSAVVWVDKVEPFLSLPMALSELSLAVWWIVFGGRNRNPANL
ncbi:MAG: DUF4386 domain-containing protein [Bacilli bacterium]